MKPMKKIRVTYRHVGALKPMPYPLEDEDECQIHELQQELERQKAFTLQVAERLFLAAEVLSIMAERRQPVSNAYELDG